MCSLYVCQILSQYSNGRLAFTLFPNLTVCFVLRRHTAGAQVTSKASSVRSGGNEKKGRAVAPGVRRCKCQVLPIRRRQKSRYEDELAGLMCCTPVEIQSEHQLMHNAAWATLRTRAMAPRLPP